MLLGPQQSQGFFLNSAVVSGFTKRSWISPHCYVTAECSDTEHNTGHKEYWNRMQQCKDNAEELIRYFLPLPAAPGCTTPHLNNVENL